MVVCHSSPSHSLWCPVMLPLLPLGDGCFFFFFIFVEWLLNFIEFLRVDGIEYLVSQILPMVNDPVPLLFSLPILHKRHIIISDFLIFHSELYFPFVFQLILLLRSIPFILLLLYFGCSFEILFIILEHFIVFCFLLLYRLENVDFGLFLVFMKFVILVSR